MRVERIELVNYRGFRELSLDFPTSTTVLVGVNGVGKTAILEAVAVMLGWFRCEFQGHKHKKFDFDPLDLRNGQSELTGSITVQVNEQRVTWSAVCQQTSGRKLKTRRDERRQRPMYELAARLQETWKADRAAPAPVIILYRTNRAVLDIPLRIRTQHAFDRFSVNEEPLADAWSNFRLFFEWFRDREDLENEERLNTPEHRDPQLEAVRKAIALLSGFRNLRVRRSPLRMTVQKDGEELIINQLSDGEKCLLALVGDLARRLAIANPGAERPLEGAGVVLIDEIELHLHPAWQRMIIPQMEKTFPNCQFIVSTHSPQVLSQVRPEGVVVLERQAPGEITCQRAGSSFGRDSNWILEDVMGVPDRPAEMKQRLREYFRLIDSDELEAARRLRAELEEQLGSDEPELVKADVLLRRKEWLKRETHQQGR